MNKYTLTLYLDDMGSFRQPGVRSISDALWHVNDARHKDNLPPMDLCDLEHALMDGEATLTKE